MLLHELTHVWHHQKLGYGYQPLKDAYTKAKASGKYDSIKHISGGTQKAYGMNNAQEFFAELTEAFFWINDMQPFQREELMQFDPHGAKVVMEAWGVDESAATV